MTYTYCNVCGKDIQECECTEDDKLYKTVRLINTLQVNTFGIEETLIDTLTYIHMLTKRIEQLEQIKEGKD